MPRFPLLGCCLLCLQIAISPGAAPILDQTMGPQPVSRERSFPAAKEASDGLFIGGVGGVYFLAQPGELVVEVEKRDRNLRATPAELRAILVGPDRRVLQEATIPDDGRAKGSGLGPVQRCRLSARVDSPGIYALNITVAQDRYGEEMVWRFRANCPKYLIETARGHKDEAHQEPIVLASAERAGDVCFLPRGTAFGMEISGLPQRAGSPVVFDANGASIATLTVNTNGQAAWQFAAKIHREAVPWRLHLPSAQATVNIDGVTRWTPADPYPDLACWTPDPASWFPWLENRWLLTPYGRTVFGKSSETKELTFQVHNNSAREKTVRLALEFPDGAWPARLSVERVVLGAKQAAPVRVSCTVPADGQTRVVRLRAAVPEDSGFSTCSTLTVQAGPAPAAKPLALPLVLKAYQHENEQFGHLPDYPVENQPYFDPRNQPFIRTSAGVAAWRDEAWAAPLLGAGVKSRTPLFEGNTFGLAGAKIAFDRDNDLYALATVGRTAALLHSSDGGKTFAAYVIPGAENHPRSFDVEQFTGHNLPDGPPPILRYTRTTRDPKLIWRSLHTLELFLPQKRDGRLTLGDPVLVSDQCIGLSAHSGIPASIVSRGSKVHVVWGEATDPKAKVAGVPTYVATYDRQTGRLGTPALVAHGPPANDIHNSPSITLDGRGFLHVLGVASASVRRPEKSASRVSAVFKARRLGASAGH